MFACVREEFHGSTANFEKIFTQKLKNHRDICKFAHNLASAVSSFSNLIQNNTFIRVLFCLVLVRYSSVINKSWDTFRICHRDNWLKRILGVQCNIRISQGRCVVIESDKQTKIHELNFPMRLASFASLSYVTWYILSRANDFTLFDFFTMTEYPIIPTLCCQN